MPALVHRDGEAYFKCSEGEHPNFSRIVATSSLISARWLCNLTPGCFLAKAAVALKNSGVHLIIAVGDKPILSMENLKKS